MYTLPQGKLRPLKSRVATTSHFVFSKTFKLRPKLASHAKLMQKCLVVCTKHETDSMTCLVMERVATFAIVNGALSYNPCGNTPYAIYYIIKGTLYTEPCIQCKRDGETNFQFSMPNHRMSKMLNVEWF